MPSDSQEEWSRAHRAAQIALLLAIEALAKDPEKDKAETAREYAEAFARLRGN